MNARIWLAGMVVSAAALGAPPSAQSQDEARPDRLLATRAELQQAQARLTAKGDADAAARVARRLSEGDFQPGDRILLEVQAESTLTDTFTVAADRTLPLPPPALGALSLQGILRAELEPHVTQFVGRFVRSPTVRATSLVRLSVQGQVARAGFYGVPARGLLSDAIMAAGGTTHDADLKKLRIERAGATLWKEQAARQLLASNQTLDELGLRSGDEIIIGKAKQGSMYDTIRFGALLVSTAVGVYTLTRIF